MWEFTICKYPGASRWTWTQLGETGRPVQRSRTEFASWAEAFGDAIAHGFDWQRNRYGLVELQPPRARAEPRLAVELAGA